MTLKDCYQSFGGNYDEVLGRLQREKMVEKFVLKFLDDKSFRLLVDALDEKQYEDALRAVHTIKGICQNLSFTRLSESSALMTKTLRDGEFERAAGMMAQVTQDYEQTVQSIKDYQQSKGE